MPLGKKINVPILMHVMCIWIKKSCKTAFITCHPRTTNSTSRKPFIPAISIPPYRDSGKWTAIVAVENTGMEWTSVNDYHSLEQEIILVGWDDLIHLLHTVPYWLQCISLHGRPVCITGSMTGFVRMHDWMNLDRICCHISMCMCERDTLQKPINYRWWKGYAIRPFYTNMFGTSCAQYDVVPEVQR